MGHSDRNEDGRNTQVVLSLTARSLGDQARGPLPCTAEGAGTCSEWLQITRRIQTCGKRCSVKTLTIRPFAFDEHFVDVLAEPQKSLSPTPVLYDVSFHGPCEEFA